MPPASDQNHPVDGGGEAGGGDVGGDEGGTGGADGGVYAHMHWPMLACAKLVHMDAYCACVMVASNSTLAGCDAVAYLNRHDPASLSADEPGVMDICESP